jgi:hypothetical protein
MTTQFLSPKEFFRGELFPLENLVIPEENIPMRRVFEMVASIKEQGLLCPIEIDEEGKVMDGVCRALAFVMMGMVEIPVIKGASHQPILGGKIIINSNKKFNYNFYLAA